jgi:prolipoprotein diacylglyceryltransferase
LVKKIFYLLLHPMKIVPNRIVYALVAMITAVSAFAGPNPNGPPPPGLPPPGLPINGGVVALMVVAILFGFFKIQQLKNKKTPA